MVEGHQCHRVAAAHRKLLVGKVFSASSPNSRFVGGATAINGRSLAKIEVHGKNLFYFFRDENAAAKAVHEHEVVHIHFGMAGAFKTMKWPGEDPTPTTRLRLENKEHQLVAHVSAMTVNPGDDAYYRCGACNECMPPSHSAALLHREGVKVALCTLARGLQGEGRQPGTRPAA